MHTLRALAAGLALAGAFAAGHAVADTLSGPLAPAAKGQMQCFKPNAERHTCESIGAYAVDAKGRVQNTAIVLVSPAQAIVMRTTSPVVMRGELECGVMRAEDIDSASFTVAGAPADADQTARLRAGIKHALLGLIGKEACMKYIPDGDHILTQTFIDGARQPSDDAPMIWVSEADGYTVAP